MTSKKIDYEKNIEEIDKIINQLELEELPLEKNIELVEKANLLTKECRDYLNSAELKIINILETKE